jgi:hypothetical protein
MTIERHDGHPAGVICRPAGNGLCEPVPSKVPDLRGVPLGVLPPGADEGPTFASGI